MSFQGRVRIIANERVAPGHYLMRLESPKLAQMIAPGQFVQLKVNDGYLPLLRRPFSPLNAKGKFLDILYAVIGMGTQIMSGLKKRDKIDILGPLGNAFSPPKKREKVLLVGGGVGIPPLYFFAERYRLRAKIEVFLGARTKRIVLCQRDFHRLGLRVHVATDDGSAGFKGYVTQLLEQWFNSRQSTVDSRQNYLYTCGPTAMMKEVARIAKRYHLEGEASHESPMACGFGICVGCAIPVINGGYKLCCYHGTVFKLDGIDWGRM